MNGTLSPDTITYGGSTRAATDAGAVLLRGTALVWTAYTLVLTLIDALLLPVLMPAASFYLIHLTGAAVLLLFAGRVNSQHALLLSISWIVLIAALSALPGIAGPLPAHTESLALRNLPVLMLALVLVAWRSTWRQLLAFCIGMALLACAPLLVAAPLTPMGPTVVVAAIQTTSFLAVSGAVALLTRQLRAQQMALEHANQQLRELAAVREELGASQERARIARELHDTLAHTLSGLSIQLEGADACWEHDPERARTIVRQAQAVVRAGLQETRRALRALRAGPVEQHGLVAALRQLATASAAAANLRLELALAPELPALLPAVEQCVYRTAQEALANVVRHAAAQTLLIQLRADAAGVELLVRDDGQGFQTTPTLPADRYGLRGLRERCEALGGALVIHSELGQGTTIQLLLPRERRAYARADLR